MASCLNSYQEIHDLRYEIDQIYKEEFPAIIPKYKVGPIKEPHQLNKSSVVSRKNRFITDITGLDIQAFSAISQHRKQSKLQKSMKHLKHRQDVLNHKIEALEDDMISIPKETFEELNYLKRELELTGYNIKVLTTENKRVEYELSRHMERIMDNSNAILFLSGTISVLLSEIERYFALHERVEFELDHILDALDNLSNNLLSHSVVRPSVFKRRIEHVKQQLAEKYANYELVITEVHDYYCYIVGLGLNCKFIDLLFKRSIINFIKISSFFGFIVSEIIYSQTDTLTLELMELR